MKYLLILLAVLVGVWLWRSGRATPTTPKSGSGKTPPPTAQDMVACAACGVHLPNTDAVRGRRGWYCGEPHRIESES